MSLLMHFTPLPFCQWILACTWEVDILQAEVCILHQVLNQFFSIDNIEFPETIFRDQIRKENVPILNLKF